MSPIFEDYKILVDEQVDQLKLNLHCSELGAIPINKSLLEIVVCRPAARRTGRLGDVWMIGLAGGRFRTLGV